MSDSKKYSVDDILADIRGEKQEEQPYAGPNRSEIDIDELLQEIIAEKPEGAPEPKAFVVKLDLQSEESVPDKTVPEVNKDETESRPAVAEKLEEPQREEAKEEPEETVLQEETASAEDLVHAAMTQKPVAKSDTGRWMAPTLSELFIDREPKQETIPEDSQEAEVVEEYNPLVEEATALEKEPDSLAAGIRQAVELQFEEEAEKPPEEAALQQEEILTDTREFTIEPEPLQEEPLDDAVGPAELEDTATDILKAAADRHRKEPSIDIEATRPFSAISKEDNSEMPVTDVSENETVISETDAEAVLGEIEKERGSMIFSVVALGLMALFGIYLLLANAYRVALPPVLDRTNSPVVYLLINTVLLVFAIVASYPSLWNGLLSLSRWRLDHNSMITVLIVFSLLQALVSFLDVASVARANVHLCAPVAVIALLLHSIGNLVVTETKYRGRKAFCTSGEKYAVYLIDDEEAGSALTRGLVDSYPLVAARKKVHTVEPLPRANLYDSSDRIARLLVPAALACGLVFAGVSLIQKSDPFLAIGVFIMVLCAFMPFGYLLSAAIPMLRGAVRLGGKGAALDTTELVDYADVNVVTLTGHDLFPEGSVQLYGIKTFSGARVDEALLDAASVIYAADGVLKDVFARILDGDESLLQPVDSLLYEDAMGLTAWIKNKRVLIGNRELMENHGVRVPSHDYENRYLDQGHDLIYLSTGGELSAVFLVQLKALPEVQEMLDRLNSNHIRIALKSVDALVTKEKLASVFDLPEECFKVIPARLHERFDEVNPTLERAEAGVVAAPGFLSFCRTLILTKRLHSALTLGMAVQISAVVLGLIWVALFTLIFPVGLMLPFTMLVYQLAWLLITCVVAVAKPLT